MCHFSLTLWVLTIFVPMPAPPPPRDKEIEGENKETFEKNLKLLVTGMEKAKTVTLLEGLPHQLYEGKSLAKERKDQKTVEWHGFPFYIEELPAGEKDVQRLQVILANVKAFKRFEIPKPCGGFHPDWCVVFRNDKEVYRVLVCFGCQEARLYGPTTDVYTDLDERAFKVLETTLKPYQKKRPKFAADLEAAPAEEPPKKP